MDDIIKISHFCNLHNIEASLLRDMDDAGLIKIVEYENDSYLKSEDLANLERYLRLCSEFSLNIEAIAIVNELSESIHKLKYEIKILKNKLSIYEN